MMTQTFIIDFDSTFVSVESLDLLATISLDGRADKVQKVKKIAAITDLGMNGDISFTDALKKRIKILEANQSHLDTLITLLKTEISSSFKRNKDFLKDNADSIYIISSGFKEFIVPVISDYGLSEDRVLANTFEFDDEENIVGADQNNPLARDGGKIKVVKKLGLEGEITAIGDGYTDYEIKKAGLATKFFAFTENVNREKVVREADYIAPSLDEVLLVEGIKDATSNLIPQKI